jgi:dTDP-4-dehydrorhamnose 3,5-epimerase
MAVLKARSLHAISRPLPGVMLLEGTRRRDERGWFARCFCREELRALGVDRPVEQANMSSSARRGTLRGLHYQLGGSAETKIVSCLHGRLYDVVLDMRESSPTFGEHFGAELTPENRRMMVIPEGCAHGFLTLADESTIFYFVSKPYDPARERGVRWDDPAFAIAWPFAPSILSERDLAHPDFDPNWHLAAA